MDKYMHHLGLLPNEASLLEASFSIETTLTRPHKQSTSPNIILMEPSILSPLEESSDHFSIVNYGPTSQNPFGFLATTSHVEIGSMNLRMMANQSVPQFPDTSFLAIPDQNFHQLAYCCPSQQVLEENFYYIMDRCPPKQHLQEHNNLYLVVDGFLPQNQPPKANLHLPNENLSQNLEQQQVPLIGYTNLKDQMPYIDQQQPSFSFDSPTWNHVDPNWEAINAYLSGKVRPSPKIAHIYKCSTCGVEFPNAQAYGGHLSSHRKDQKKKKLAANEHRLEKVNLKRPSSNIRKAIVLPSSRKSIPLKEARDEKNDMKNKKFECESQDSMPGSFIWKDTKCFDKRS